MSESDPHRPVTAGELNEEVAFLVGLLLDFDKLQLAETQVLVSRLAVLGEALEAVAAGGVLPRGVDAAAWRHELGRLVAARQSSHERLEHVLGKRRKSGGG